MTEPDLKQAQASSRRGSKLAITLFLIGVVVVSGTAAFYSRNAWWEKYLNYLHSKP